MEKNLKKYRDKYICITESFCCIPETRNIVIQLTFNNNNKRFENQVRKIY